MSLYRVNASSSPNHMIVSTPADTLNPLLSGLSTRISSSRMA